MFESKQIVKKFINLDENTFLSVSKRCTWFTYEESNIQNKICKMLFEYNPNTAELYVATKTNIRCIDLHTGKINRVLANVVEKGEEITKVKIHYDNTEHIGGQQQRRH